MWDRGALVLAPAKRERIVSQQRLQSHYMDTLLRCLSVPVPRLTSIAVHVLSQFSSTLAMEEA